MTEKGKDKDNRANRLYGQAQAALREAHRDEFTALLKAAYEAEGLVYRPRLTAEERAVLAAEAKRAKAKAKMDALLAEFPDLVDEQPLIDFPAQP